MKICIFTTNISTQLSTMKAMLKSELARMAGVSRNTLSRWMVAHQEALAKRGYQKQMRLLPPHLVEYVMRQYGIVADNV